MPYQLKHIWKRTLEHRRRVAAQQRASEFKKQVRRMKPEPANRIAGK